MSVRVSDYTSRMVAANVRRIRVDKGLTLDDVATAMTDQNHPMIKSSLSKLETGQRTVTAGDLVILSQILEVNLGELLRGDVCPTCRRPMGV